MTITVETMMHQAMKEESAKEKVARLHDLESLSETELLALIAYRLEYQNIQGDAIAANLERLTQAIEKLVGRPIPVEGQVAVTNPSSGEPLKVTNPRHW